MAAPLDDDVRKQIYAMFSKNLPTGVIVERTGASKSTIKRMRTQWKERRGPTDAPAHAIKRVEPVEPQGAQPDGPDGPTVEPDDPREEMARLARDHLSFVVQRAKEGYLRASLSDDEHDRAWMETQYLKVLHTSAVQLGKWAGLDDAPKAIPAINPMERFAEALDEYRDLEDS